MRMFVGLVNASVAKSHCSQMQAFVLCVVSFSDLKDTHFWSMLLLVVYLQPPHHNYFTQLAAECKNAKSCFSVNI